MKWTQLFIKAPEGNGYTTPQAMKRVDDHLVQSFPASFCAPDGMPVQEKDGTWEVRVLDATYTPLVEGILKRHYGLEIVRKEERE